MHLKKKTSLSMPKLKISGVMWYLLWFLRRNERNKCGGVPKWLYMVGNLKKKVDCSKKPSEKEKRKEKGLEQKKKKWKRKKKKKIEV